MANKWLTHVKKTMKAHKGAKFSAVLKMAKKTYKGGADVTPYSDSSNGADLYNGRGTLQSASQDAGPAGGRRRKTRRGGGAIPGKAVGGRRRRTLKGKGYGMY
jgi:hypothetical protein